MAATGGHFSSSAEQMWRFCVKSRRCHPEEKIYCVYSENDQMVTFLINRQIVLSPEGVIEKERVAL